MTFAGKSLIRLAGSAAMLFSCACNYAGAETFSISILNETKSFRISESQSSIPHPQLPRSEDLHAAHAIETVPVTPGDQNDKKGQPVTDAEISSSQVSFRREGTDSKPMVIYERGELTITAENVSLSNILSALHTVMGTEIDLPAVATDEKIWVHLGPGPARKIVTDLLSNTDLNYVIQGSPKDLNGIQSVMLSVRTDAGPSKPEVSSQSASRTKDRQRENSAATDTTDEGVHASEEPSVAAEVPPPLPEPPTVDPHPALSSVNSSEASSIPNPSPPAVLSEEHIVQQLTNMYQQRKQLQQNQTPATPN